MCATSVSMSTIMDRETLKQSRATGCASTPISGVQSTTSSETTTMLSCTASSEASTTTAITTSFDTTTTTTTPSTTIMFTVALPLSACNALASSSDTAADGVRPRTRKVSAYVESFNAGTGLGCTTFNLDPVSGCVRFGTSSILRACTTSNTTPTNSATVGACD